MFLMKAVLKIIAVLVGLAVTLTVLMICRFALEGQLTKLAHSGSFGMMTFAAWIVILGAGPVASVQLWRLRRLGLFVTAMLCGLALSYYIVGALLFSPPGVVLSSGIVRPVAVNAAMIALLLSPPSRRACRD